jgi:hypothetical protein
MMNQGEEEEEEDEHEDKDEEKSEPEAPDPHAVGEENAEPLDMPM